MNTTTKSQDAAFDSKRHIYGAILGPLCALLIWVSPFESLTAPEHRLLAIMALVAIWWITEPVAIPVTSLLGPTLCVLFEIMYHGVPMIYSKIE